MTATASRKAKTALHEFEGSEVHRATVAIRKAGDGLSDGLAIDPDEIKQGEVRYYVLRTPCGAVNFKTDDKKITTREHVMNATGISPVDADVAEDFLSRYHEEVQRRLTEIDGQLRLDSESEAEQAEADDANLPPDEVAAKAAERAKRPTA
jgi:hypothetical protein